MAWVTRCRWPRRPSGPQLGQVDPFGRLLRSLLARLECGPALLDRLGQGRPSAHPAPARRPCAARAAARRWPSSVATSSPLRPRTERSISSSAARSSGGSDAGRHLVPVGVRLGGRSRSVMNGQACVGGTVRVNSVSAFPGHAGRPRQTRPPTPFVCPPRPHRPPASRSPTRSSAAPGVTLAPVASDLCGPFPPPETLRDAVRARRPGGAGHRWRDRGLVLPAPERARAFPTPG